MGFRLRRRTLNHAHRLLSSGWVYQRLSQLQNGDYWENSLPDSLQLDKRIDSFQRAYSVNIFPRVINNISVVEQNLRNRKKINYWVFLKKGSWDWKASLEVAWSKQSELEQAVHNFVQLCFEYLQEQRLHSLYGQPLPAFNNSWLKSFFPMSKLNFPYFSLCPLPYVQWLPLRKAWLCLLHSLPSGIFPHE